jgi:MATE family multidrug resistance protein
MGFLALRFCSEGVGSTRPIMYAAVLGLAANVGLNYLLMYGKFGLPALGAVGCGVATAIVQWLMFGFMWWYVRWQQNFPSFALATVWRTPDREALAEVLRLGLPISGSVLAEGALFSAAGLMASTFGGHVMAAHAIALNYAALMFMVPLSLHSATTIHVGHRIGAGDRRGGVRAGWIGIICCVAVMLVSALLLIAIRHQVAALYTADTAVADLAAMLLLYAAAFQVADGLQVGAAGALRGVKDARIPMLLNLLAYWVIAFPVGWYGAFVAGGGVAAVWQGLIVGLLACAIALTLRYHLITRPIRMVATL